MNIFHLQFIARLIQPRIYSIAAEVGAALVGGATSLIGGILGNNSAKKEAAKNREFQERMARNAHQYEVEDLRKAGLNPVLSAMGGSGAATPGGAVANVGNPAKDVVSSASAASAAAIQKDQSKEVIRGLAADADAKELNADALKQPDPFSKPTYKTVWRNGKEYTELVPRPTIAQAIQKETLLNLKKQGTLLSTNSALNAANLMGVNYENVGRANTATFNKNTSILTPTAKFFLEFLRALPGH